MSRRDDRSATSESDVTRANIERFASETEVDEYERAIEDGLFAPERTIVDRYYGLGETILDVGCGVGRTTVRLDQRGYDVIGLDTSEPSIERARSLFPDIEFEVGNALELAFPNDRFDHVLFSYNGIDNLHPASARRNALAEFHRVLDPDGTLAFSSRNDWYRFPALVTDPGFVRRFYLDPRNWGRLFDRYKILGPADDPYEIYVSNPRHQRRQLRRCGFDLVDVIGKRDGVARYFEISPYYVATPS